MGMEKGIKVLTILKLQPSHHLHLRDLAGTIQGRDGLFEQHPLQLLLGGRLLGLEVLRERIRNRHQDFHSQTPSFSAQESVAHNVPQCNEGASVTPTQQWPRLASRQAALCQNAE